MTKTDFKNTYEAFMHCDKNKLAKEFAAMYSDNETIMAIVIPSENICRISPGETYPTATPQPTLEGTATPIPTETPFVIPTPVLPTP